MIRILDEDVDKKNRGDATKLNGYWKITFMKIGC